jgi:hypothetical protein
MASAIDDLRYISRYGYQDPWAEATKNITDSLLAYGQSKLKRDTLIAEYKDKKEQLDYTRNRNAQTDAMNMIKGESPEVKSAFLNNEEFVKNLPESYVEAMKPIVGQQVNYNKAIKSLYDTVIGDGTVDERISALNTAKKSFRSDDKYNPPRFNRELTALTKQVDEDNKSRLVSILAQQYYDKGILNRTQYDIITKEKSATNADLLLKDALRSERTEITDILEMYEGSIKAWEDTKERLHLEDSWLTVRVKQLEKELTPFLDSEVRTMRRKDGSEYTFKDKVIIQQLGHKQREQVKQTGFLKPFYEEYPYDAKITEAGGGVTKLSSPTFSVDSNDRFALNESDFTMPPESQVELEYPNGQKKIVTGQNAYQQLKLPGVKLTGQKSGIYLKIGVGTHPLLNRRAGSKIAGLIDDDSTMDVGIVYQNPSKGQYESFSGVKDTAFTTRNIKLRDNDLLIDVETGSYHKVIIIPPPKGKALRFTLPDPSTVEEIVTKGVGLAAMAAAPFKEALTTRPLDKTIFRVGGNDYNAQELIKKYMIPMNVPKESQPEQVKQAPSAPRLIKITPSATSSTDSIAMSPRDDTYREWLLRNIDKSTKKKALK